MGRRWTDHADWDGVEMESLRNEKNRYRFEGYPHATIGEQMLAKLLKRQGIPYTPDVRLTFRDELGKGGVVFVPDFVFNKTAYVWEDDKRRRFLIHGIEVKRASKGFFPPRAIRKVKLLRDGRRIVILLMSHKQIRFFRARGKLPLSVPRMRKTKDQRAAARLPKRSKAP